MKQALIGGGNSQRSTYQAHCGDKGWNRAQRVEVSTLPRKADEARMATGADPEPMRERTPQPSARDKSLFAFGSGGRLNNQYIGDSDAEKVGNLEMANQLRILGEGL